MQESGASFQRTPSKKIRSRQHCGIIKSRQFCTIVEKKCMGTRQIGWLFRGCDSYKLFLKNIITPFKKTSICRNPSIYGVLRTRTGMYSWFLTWSQRAWVSTLSHWMTPWMALSLWEDDLSALTTLPDTDTDIASDQTSSGHPLLVCVFVVSTVITMGVSIKEVAERLSI